MSLTERLNRKNKKFVAAPGAADAAPAKQMQGTTGFSVTADEAREKEYQTIKSDIHAKIIDEMPEALQRAINQSTGDQKEVRRMVENICAEEVRNNPFAVPLGDRERLVDELISEIMGLGPIEPFLQDSSVSEVMVNGPDSIYIERSGHLIKTETRFRNAEHLMHIIDRIVSAVGRRVDESSPMVDARLLDGSRVNVIIPPLS